MCSDDEVIYTCAECGHHEFHFEHHYDYFQVQINYLPSSSESEEYAASYREVVKTSHIDTYLLDDTHHADDRIESEEIDKDTHTEDLEIFCPEEYEQASELDWISDELESESGIYEDNEDYFVKCANCDREIQFGWSHENRGGRIWPVEANDFNPWKNWPELKYYDDWKKKNWLRPSK